MPEPTAADRRIPRRPFAWNVCPGCGGTGQDWDVPGEGRASRPYICADCGGEKGWYVDADGYPVDDEDEGAEEGEAGPGSGMLALAGKVGSVAAAPAEEVRNA